MFPDDGETRYWLPPLTRADCIDLMAGRVPEDLGEACRRMVEWSLATPLGTHYEGLNANYQRKQQEKPRPRKRAR